MAVVQNVGSDHFRIQLTATDRETPAFQLSRLMPRGNVRTAHGKAVMHTESAFTTSRLRLDFRAAPSMKWRVLMLRIGSGINSFEAYPNAEYRLFQLETVQGSRQAGDITVIIRAD